MLFRSAVVTANKKLLAEYGKEIFDAAAKNGVDIYFGASVGGGIPIIRAVREGLAGNEIQQIHGILNGTCNYILTRMENEGRPFDEILADAQKLGYAEADPSLILLESFSVKEQNISLGCNVNISCK